MAKMPLFQNLTHCSSVIDSILVVMMFGTQVVVSLTREREALIRLFSCTPQLVAEVAACKHLNANSVIVI